MSHIKLVRPDGKLTYAYLAEPTAPDAKGNVVVLHGMWGMSDETREVCTRLAGEGFRALAVDFYDGQTAADATQASVMANAIDWREAITQNVQVAIEQVRAFGGYAAVMGFDSGGALAIAAGLNMAEVNAVVSFYGIAPADCGDPSMMRAGFIGHFADEDDWCKPAFVDHLEEKLKEGAVEYAIHRYPARHGFFSKALPGAYDKRAADLAWGRTVAFLGEQLKARPMPPGYAA